MQQYDVTQYTSLTRNKPRKIWNDLQPNHIQINATPQMRAEFFKFCTWHAKYIENDYHVTYPFCLIFSDQMEHLIIYRLWKN